LPDFFLPATTLAWFGIPVLLIPAALILLLRYPLKLTLVKKVKQALAPPISAAISLEKVLYNPVILAKLSFSAFNNFLYSAKLAVL
jgi:hypothetical protein